ncbi:nucleoside deaminase [Propioniciclava flava]
MPVTPLRDTDLPRLERCLSLAEEALAAGDQPFGSVLVDADGKEVYAERNRIANGDDTQHPELNLARWAAHHMAPAERARATVYTSSEHCPMCAAAHGWVGLGRIVYASSSEQLHGWLRGFGLAAGRVAPLPIETVVPDALVCGPAPQLADRVRSLHARYYDAHA